MKVQVGDYDVLASGSVISVKSEPIIFHVDDALPCTIVFADTADNEDEVTIKFDVARDGLTLTMTLTNFNSRLGGGNSERALLGYLGDNNERELYLDLMVYAPNGKGGPKLMHYTWLTKPAIPK